MDRLNNIKKFMSPVKRIVLVGFPIFIVFLIFLYKNLYYPLATLGDENAYIAYAFRIINYAQRDWPLYFSDSYNFGTNVMMPFPNANLLSLTLFKLFGVSQYNGKIFSSLFMLIITFGFCIFVYLRTNSWIKYILSLSALCILPSILITGRLIRPESETFFLGLFSFFIIFNVFQFAKSKYKFLWIISGYFSAMAVCDHPLGVMFPLIIFLGIFLFSNSWKQLDDLNLLSRYFYWFSGMLIPSIYFTYRLNLYGFKRFFECLHYLKTEFYAPLNQLFIDYFTKQHALSNIFLSFPKLVQSKLIQLNYYTLLPANYSLNLPTIVVFIYHCLVWITLALAIGYLRYINSLRKNVENLFLNMTWLGLVMSTTITLAFNINQVYHCYVAFFMTVFLISNCWLSKDFAQKLFIPQIFIVMLSCLVVANLSYMFVYLKYVYKIDDKSIITIDKNMAAMSYMRSNLAKYEGRAYVEPSAWEVGTKNLGAISEIFYDHGPVQEPTIIAFQEKVFDYYLNYYSSARTNKTSSEIMYGKIKPYIENLELNYLFLNYDNPSDIYRVYGKDDGLKVMIFEKNIITIYQAVKNSNWCKQVLEPAEKDRTFLFMVQLEPKKVNEHLFQKKGYLIKNDKLENFIIINYELLKNIKCNEEFLSDSNMFTLKPIEHMTV